jgi:hypothetical protein
MAKVVAKVKKSMNDQEKVVIDNIYTLLDELKNAENTEDEEAQNDTVEKEATDTTEEQDETVEDKPEKETKAKKALEQTESDAGEANSDAEDRIDETQSEDNIENIDAVAKAVLQRLVKMSVPKKVVVKSESSELTNAILALVKVAKAQNERIESTEQAFGNLLEGLGVAKQMEIAEKKVEKKAKPVVSSDPLAVLKQLLTEAGMQVQKGEDDNKGEAPSSVVHKNLSNRNVLQALVTGFNK